MSRCLMFLALSLTLLGCTTLPNNDTTNYTQSTPHPILVATAQADQIARDAAATTAARQMISVGLTATYQADYQNVQATTQAFATTKQAGEAQATATTAVQQTRDTLHLVLTTEAATIEAQQTATAVVVAMNATAVQESREAAQQTATAAAVATETSFTATKQALELAQIAAVQQRQQIISYLLGFFLILAGILAIILLVWFGFKAIPLLITRLGVIRYGQHQNPLLIVEKNGRSTFTDPLRMLQAGMTVDEDGRLEMPELTPSHLQTYLTQAVMQLLHEQTHHPPQLPSEISQSLQIGGVKRERVEKRPKREAKVVIRGAEKAVSEKSPLGSEPPTVALPQQVSWPELIMRPPAEGQVTLGVGAVGRVHLDLQRTPHILLSGSSGSGKTRRCLRPLIAQALATGTFVVILNESGADFAPFYDHGNCAFIRGDVGTYMTVLEATLSEMNRRESILRQHRISEWHRLPTHLQDGPPLLIVIDEVLALAMLMSHKEQQAFWGALAAYASRARKLSMGSVGALTDPTYRILKHGMNWREQCNARITFRVAKPNISRAVLDEGGAEMLEEGQFLAMLGRTELIRGLAAHPNDEQLRTYLQAHRRGTVARPRWLPLTSGSPHQLSEPPEPVLNRFAVAETASLPEPELVLPLDPAQPLTAAAHTYIHQLAAQGWSKNKICQTVYGFKNGRTYGLVSEALAEGGANQSQNE